MLTKILATRNDFAATALRIFLGLVILPHGLQKVFGWFGGFGFTGTMHHFTETMGIPYLLALLAIIAESAGAAALIAGFLTRISAFGVGITIAVGALMVHLDNGFFMNWFGNQAGEGFEYHLLVVGMALALMISGGGSFSVDRLISGKK